MDFESPDVEREFPGLYASESGSGKRSQESDSVSDEAHEKSTKKDLLIGKRKDKKESKKDLGYAALEGESSPEEELDVKSPCKSKKSKSFKFPTIKEKREKSREKDIKDKDKEKERERDKDIDRDKEKKKESKSKLKLKDKKKVKADESVDCVDELPVFGVHLSIAVDRSRCHDGVELPVVVRDCIDHIQDNGLGVEGIYKVSGVKSKVQQLRRSYNKREAVKLNDFDTSTVTSLLKLFLRELPDPLLTGELSSKFEEVANIKELTAREHELSSLLTQLPICNRICLSWIIRHLESVASNECLNKMTVNALGTTLCPAMQTSSRVLTALLTHSSALFSNIKLIRYIPPLSAGCTSLPNSRDSIIAELKKQDSLLNQIHSEMNQGCTIRSDQLWEVQRFITQLKRKLRSIEKALEVPAQTSDELQSKLEQTNTVVPALSSTKIAAISPVVDDKLDFQLQVAAEEAIAKGGSAGDAEEKENTVEVSQEPVLRDETDASVSSCAQGNSESLPPVSTSPGSSPVLAPVLAQEPTPVPADVPSPVTAPSPSSTIPISAAVSDQSEHGSSPESNEQTDEMQLYLEQMELLKLHACLTSRISDEREEIETLQMEVNSIKNSLQEPFDQNSENIDAPIPVEHMDIPEDMLEEDERRRKEREKELINHNLQLMQDRLNLVKQIMYEHEACVSLRVQMELLFSK